MNPPSHERGRSGRMLTDQHELLGAVKQLDPLPPTVARLAALLIRPDWEIEEVLDCIRFDQVLTAKLLRAANPALWFRGHTIAELATRSSFAVSTWSKR